MSEEPVDPGDGEERRMELTFGREAHRVKSRSWPLGAARARLFLVLRDLGLRRDEIEARLDSERELARSRELDRQIRLQIQAEMVRRIEETQGLLSSQEQQSIEEVEARKVARRLSEARAFDQMSEEEQTTWRFEDQIVHWICEEI